MSTKKDPLSITSLKRLLTKKHTKKRLVNNNTMPNRIIDGQAYSVVSVIPASGPVSGGTTVKLTGTNLAHVSTVMFAGIVAPTIRIIDKTTVLAVTPSHNAGSVDVMIKTSDSSTAVLSRGFTYKKETSYLIDDSHSMERARRRIEQDGHRMLTKVHAREHRDDITSTPEGELQHSILQHPLLSMQRFDGIDPHLNPEPSINNDARREFDNERREQEMEKQLRLGNMPKFSTAPKPSPR
jgi:hypothetical protein